MKKGINWMVPVGVMLVLAVTASLVLTPGAMAENAGTVVMVNINTAEQGELASLPGIGTSKADAIIAYRSKHGPFQKIEDLTSVRGIGDNILEKIRTLIEIK